MGIFAAVALLNWNLPLGALPLRQFLMPFLSVLPVIFDVVIIFSQNAFKRPSPDPFTAGDSPKGGNAKKAKPAARKAAKKKKDPNEPSK